MFYYFFTPCGDETGKAKQRSATAARTCPRRQYQSIDEPWRSDPPLPRVDAERKLKGAGWVARVRRGVRQRNGPAPTINRGLAKTTGTVMIRLAGKRVEVFP